MGNGVLRRESFVRLPLRTDVSVNLGVESKNPRLLDAMVPSHIDDGYCIML
jgi:hypothetical protein